jgi:hypothetical protein
MAPAKATSSRSAKAARKPAAKASAAASASRTKATRAKAKQARVSPKGQSTLRQAQTTSKDTAEVVSDYAERAVLIPVGAALIARDRVVSSVSDTISTYSSTSKTNAQLRRFERRGATARNRLEREVRKARVRVERDLRQRRRVIENTVSDLETRRDDIATRVPDIANRVPELANRVQERILSLV